MPMKTESSWIALVKKVKKDNPSLMLKEVLKKASAMYKKK